MSLLCRNSSNRQAAPSQEAWAYFEARRTGIEHVTWQILSGSWHNLRKGAEGVQGHLFTLEKASETLVGKETHNCNVAR